jgi:hypothetical protein
MNPYLFELDQVTTTTTTHHHHHLDLVLHTLAMTFLSAARCLRSLTHSLTHSPLTSLSLTVRPEPYPLHTMPCTQLVSLFQYRSHALRVLPPHRPVGWLDVRLCVTLNGLTQSGSAK